MKRPYIGRWQSSPLERHGCPLLQRIWIYFFFFFLLHFFHASRHYGEETWDLYPRRRSIDGSAKDERIASRLVSAQKLHQHILRRPTTYRHIDLTRCHDSSSFLFSNIPILPLHVWRGFGCFLEASLGLRKTSSISWKYSRTWNGCTQREKTDPSLIQLP